MSGVVMTNPELLKVNRNPEIGKNRRRGNRRRTRRPAPLMKNGVVDGKITKPEVNEVIESKPKPKELLVADKVDDDDLCLYILDTNNPFGITAHNYKLLERYLINQVDLAISKGKSPKFLGISIDNGIVQISCRDSPSYRWLFSLGPRLADLWNDGALCLVNKKGCKRTIVSTTIPGPLYPIETVMKRIIGQNRTIAIKKWIVCSYGGGNGVTLNLSIDEDALDALTKFNFKLKYLFTEIFFEIIR